MVYFPLILTSLGFFIPTVIAIRNKKYAHSALIGTLACTSCLYHGTLHCFAHVVDKIVAHFTGFVFVLHTCKYHICERRMENLQRVIIGCSAIWTYWYRSRLIEGDNSSKWHLYVHIASIISMNMYCKSDYD